MGDKLPEVQRFQRYGLEEGIFPHNHCGKIVDDADGEYVKWEDFRDDALVSAVLAFIGEYRAKAFGDYNRQVGTERAAMIARKYVDVFEKILK